MPNISVLSGNAMADNVADGTLVDWAVVGKVVEYSMVASWMM